MTTQRDTDSLTGRETTGHEWDGIKELNTPLPKWWLYVFYATVLWALVYVVLYPAIPWFSGHSKGMLGWSQRVEFSERMAAGRAEQAKFRERILDASLADIRGNPELLSFALAGGRAAFADNCAPCHGAGGSGRKGFPNLADDAWLWGGTLDAIHQTIEYGIRSTHAETRQSVMPSFGADGILTPEQINDVAEYVLSLTNRSSDPAAVERGQTVFADQCVACHGEKGAGNPELGAPSLAGQNWLYGGTKRDIVAQVTRPRLGVMPAWSGRLDPATIKMLAIYVHSLGGGQQAAEKPASQ
ncbi:MAG: cytochrome-c oxidase, cbb3-type subunit III [Alphaproteobacteria bacterium]